MKPDSKVVINTHLGIIVFLTYNCEGLSINDEIFGL